MGSQPWIVHLGPVCMSYLCVTIHSRFPRSVHNTRIERMWYDVTRSYGQKWKNFFADLETNCGLTPNIPAHIWLLHHLFLDAINQDAAEWVQMWNNHVIQIKGM